MDILLKELDVNLWLSEKDSWPVRMEIRSSGLYGDGRELRVHLLLDIKRREQRRHTGGAPIVAALP